jgi:hypothetical protein
MTPFGRSLGLRRTHTFGAFPAAAQSPLFLRLLLVLRRLSALPSRRFLQLGFHRVTLLLVRNPVSVKSGEAQFDPFSAPCVTKNVGNSKPQRTLTPFGLSCESKSSQLA